MPVGQPGKLRVNLLTLGVQERDGLLIAKHHLKDRIQVWSGGSDYYRNGARLACYVHLYYPLTQSRADRDAGLILA
jgi:hypothetical protein